MGIGLVAFPSHFNVLKLMEFTTFHSRINQYGSSRSVLKQCHKKQPYCKNLCSSMLPSTVNHVYCSDSFLRQWISSAVDQLWDSYIFDHPGTLSRPLSAHSKCGITEF
ncbi:hypothetical protein T4A_2611, partial [Trichinella pseudospiralis]